MSERLLVLVRHGQSEWNLKNLFTGWKDIDLTEQGVAEAKKAGEKLKARGFKFDVAFTSVLKRAQRTLDLILAEMGSDRIPIIKDQALNERDYGDLVGMNKDDARKKWGEEQVLIATGLEPHSEEILSAQDRPAGSSAAEAGRNHSSSATGAV